MKSLTKLRQINIDILRLLSTALVLGRYYSLYNTFFIRGVHGVVLFFFISSYCIQISAYQKYTFSVFLKARYNRLLLVFLISILIVANIIFFMEFFKNQKLNSKLISYFGFLTYAIYLLHQEIGLIVISWSKKMSIPFPVGQFLAIFIVVSLAVLVQKLADEIARVKIT